MRIHGRVQGVGFRWFARTRARAAGVTGTVRNRDDGTVEVLASGDAAALAAFRRDLSVGPPGALVERIEEAPAADVPTADFRIVR